MKKKLRTQNFFLFGKITKISFALAILLSLVSSFGFAQTSSLYLIGDATPLGWNKEYATQMTQSSSNTNIFSWEGYLNTGSFKFLTTKADWVPSYNKGADNSTLLYRASFSDPDDVFSIASAGRYKIEVNVNALSVVVAPVSGPIFSKLWIVGDATPNGWNIANPNELKVDGSNAYSFRYNGFLKAGEFKFPTAIGDWDIYYYMPLTNNPELNSPSIRLAKTPDQKWKILSEGNYKIQLNVQNNTVNINSFTPAKQIWLFGSATVNGWDINNATALAGTSDPNVFTYTGNFNAGEFKIALQKSFSGDFYMPSVDQQGTESTEMSFVSSSSGIDRKWKITNPGTYTLSINQLNESITITPGSVLPVGLLDYTAIVSEGSIKLNWVTASERNNSHFEIYRATDEKAFTLQATVKAGEAYWFTDAQPLTGNNYYKLVQVDINGSKTELGTKLVNYTSLIDATTIVYPNPANSIVQVNFERGNYSIAQLIDLVGNVIKELKLGSEDVKTSFDLTGLNIGTYLIKLSGKGELKIQKLVKN